MKQFLQWSITGLTLMTIVACGGAPTSNNKTSNDDAPAESTAASPIATAPNSEPSTAPAAPPKSATSATPEASPVTAAPANPAPVASSKPPQPIAAANQTEEVTVYRLDNQCENFVAEKMTVPKANATNKVVGEVIAKSNSPDFRIENYRISVNNGTATVDLRLPPDAKRPFAAMSTCEQRSLLGSMQKTLIDNPSLKIQSVRFTDGKEELIF